MYSLFWCRFVQARTHWLKKTYMMCTRSSGIILLEPEHNKENVHSVYSLFWHRFVGARTHWHTKTHPVRTHSSEIKNTQCVRTQFLASFLLEELRFPMLLPVHFGFRCISKIMLTALVFILVSWVTCFPVGTIVVGIEWAYMMCLKFVFPHMNLFFIKIFDSDTH